MPMPFSMPNSPMPPRPMSKPPEKPPAPQQAKPFGGGFKSWDDLKGSARKFPWEKSVLPGTSRQLGEQERVKMIEELQKLDPSSGGLSEQTYKERILPKLKRQVSQLDAAGKITEKTELQRRIQMHEKFFKGE